MALLDMKIIGDLSLSPTLCPTERQEELGAVLRERK